MENTVDKSIQVTDNKLNQISNKAHSAYECCELSVYNTTVFHIINTFIYTYEGDQN